MVLRRALSASTAAACACQPAPTLPHTLLCPLLLKIAWLPAANTAHPPPSCLPAPPQVRIALLQANLARTGMEDGLVVLGGDMAAQLTAGLPECVPVAA